MKLINLKSINSEGLLLKLGFIVNNSFTDDSTIVKMNWIKWNESDTMKNPAKATILNSLVEVKEDNIRAPIKFELQQNYPNPFNPITNITFTVPKHLDVVVSIHNLSGQLVDVLFSDPVGPGKFTVIWDASNFSSGVYFCKIKAGTFVEMKKMIYLR